MTGPCADGLQDRPCAEPPLVTLISRAGLFLMLAGSGLALTLWMMFLEDLSSFSLNNVLPHRSVWRVLLTMLASGTAFVAIPAAYCIIRHTRQAVTQMHRLASVLLPLSLSFALPLFLRLDLWKSKELFFCTSVLIWGLVLERSLRVAFEAWPRTALLPDLRELYPRFFRWAPRVVVGLMTVGFFGYMSYYTILRHLQMETRAYDLGVYNNTFWNLLRGELFYSSPCLGMRGSQLQYHATLTAYLLLPLYAIYQRAESLLVIQAGLCALAAIPLYGLVKRRLDSSWMAVGFVAAYFLYAPAHGAIFYDFHFLTISPVFVITTLYFFETRKQTWLWISLGIALLNREDLGIGLAGAFLFYLISGERPWAALVGGLVSMAYVVFGKFVLLPAFSFSLADSFIYAYKEFTTKDAPSFAGVLRTWATNPYFFASKVLNEGKLTYFMLVLVPVLLLPLRNPRTWLFLVLGAIITVFSYGYPPLLMPCFQYTAAWTAFIFVASAIAIGAFKDEVGGRARMGAAVVAMLLASGMMSHNFGAFVHSNGFRGGFAPVSFELSETDRVELADLRALIAQIPPEASVTVSELESPQVSSRRDAFTLRNGYNGSDYILIRSAEARGGAGKNVMTLAIQSGQYGIVETRGAFQLWKKGASPRGNVAAARALGIQVPAPVPAI